MSRIVALDARRQWKLRQRTARQQFVQCDNGEGHNSYIFLHFTYNWIGGLMGYSNLNHLGILYSSLMFCNYKYYEKFQRLKHNNIHFQIITRFDVSMLQRRLQSLDSNPRPPRLSRGVGVCSKLIYCVTITTTLRSRFICRRNRYLRIYRMFVFGLL